MIKATPVAMYEKADQMRRMLYELRFRQAELRAVMSRMEEMSPLDTMRDQLRQIRRRLQLIEDTVEILQRALQQAAGTYSQYEERNITRSRYRPQCFPRFAWFANLNPVVFRDIQLI